jgi:ligand-binding sensor domain-containing protein
MLTLFDTDNNKFLRAGYHLIIIGLLTLNMSCKKDTGNPDSDFLLNSGFIEISFSSLTNLPINTIMIDSSGLKWIGTPKGLFIYNNSKWYQYPDFNGLNIYSIALINNLVAIGSSNGAYTMSIGTNEINSTESILGNITGSNSDTVFSYGYDRLEKKWAGTLDGLSYFDGTVWKRNQAIKNNLGGIWNVRSMAFINNDCYFGTYGKFLFHLKYSKKGTVDAITGASQMLGGAEDPVNNFNGELTTDTIYCVYAGSDSSLWFGSEAGLTRNKGATNKDNGFFEYFLRGQRVHCILETSGKDIWAGTENGLFLRKDDLWSNYTTSDGLPANIINSIAEDRDLTFWVGTNNGISHFMNNTWIDYNNH